METSEQVIERLKELPEDMHYEVLDFVEFLIIKYNRKEQALEGELSSEQKRILDERYEMSQNNPESRIEWDDLKSELFERFQPSKNNQENEL
ncbi:MAG: DUF2281 domain-containing protein [Okeania sp. SIO3C4]|nr:DUF2281 domain-containing protein [Okeania sp. SIO3C4]